MKTVEVKTDGEYCRYDCFYHSVLTTGEKCELFEEALIIDGYALKTIRCDKCKQAEVVNASKN